MNAVVPTMLTLQRIRRTSSATFGELRRPDGSRLCYTLERPWLDNQPDVSCIVAQCYQVARRFSPKRGHDVWGLLDVPGRSDIEIHAANDPRELEGCIAPGMLIGEVDTPRFGPGYGVQQSDAALALLDHELAGVTTWTLAIRDIQPTLTTPPVLADAA